MCRCESPVQRLFLVTSLLSRFYLTSWRIDLLSTGVGVSVHSSPPGRKTRWDRRVPSHSHNTRSVFHRRVGPRVYRCDVATLVIKIPFALLTPQEGREGVTAEHRGQGSTRKQKGKRYISIYIYRYIHNVRIYISYIHGYIIVQNVKERKKLNTYIYVLH